MGEKMRRQAACTARRGHEERNQGDGARGARTVDGAGARDAGMQVDGAQSDVRLDGRRLCYKAVRHVMLNKPSGVLTAARDKKQKTVMDLLPPMYAAMGAMPAGRLDKDTGGCWSSPPTASSRTNHFAPARGRQGLLRQAGRRIDR